MVRSLPIATALVVAALLGCQSRPAVSCRAAENVVIDLTIWNSVYRAFKNYAACDDGAIAAGFSDQIVHLLSRDWGSLQQAQGLFKKDPDFEQFVLNHIDPSADESDLVVLSRLARDQCPSGAGKLCSQIAAAADDR